ncbi:hypothetical protein B2J88_08030 [Rhodococcus sp. SRB_17]|nr:hypothetical protein [Rhodococcus sp. SRB_17]
MAQGEFSMADEVVTETVEETVLETVETEAEKVEETKEPDWKAESRKHEREAKANRAAAAELEKIKADKMSDDEKRDAALKDANERAEKAEARAAVSDAASKHGITDKSDLAFLSSVPADEVEALAKRLAKPATAGKSGTEVTGSKAKAPLEQQLADAQKARDFQKVVALRQQIAAR